LANVTKYAQASAVEVTVARMNGVAVVEVADDGVGGADPLRGSGLRGLADRVAALSGQLDVQSPPGVGTRVRAEIPLEEAPMPNLPHGPVPLVFTDVEGSTQLVQRLGDRYAQVLDDHRRLFRGAVEAGNGIVVDQRGDEFFVAFADARAAAGAVVAAQRALAEHEWPSGVDLRVRMGIHTGEPNIRDGTYFGLDVHRAGRICH